jgi:hypothetical protein
MIDYDIYMKERRDSIYVLNARHQVWLCWDIPHRGTYCLGCSWNNSGMSLSPPRGIPRPVIPLVKVIVKWGA